jgi:hypothetical protein
VAPAEGTAPAVALPPVGGQPLRGGAALDSAADGSSAARLLVPLAGGLLGVTALFAVRTVRKARIRG